MKTYAHHLFPKVVSYNHFVGLEKEIEISLALFIKKVLLGNIQASVLLTALR